MATRISRTMTSYGHIDQFCSEKKSIEAYLERIDIYFKANEISDEKSVDFPKYSGRKYLFAPQGPTGTH